MKIQLTRRYRLAGAKETPVIRSEMMAEITKQLISGAASRKSVISAGERIGKRSLRVVKGQQPSILFVPANPLSGEIFLTNLSQLV